jgi:hypothetical protein
VKRTEIAVRGAPSTGVLRLELNGRPGDEGLALEFLHDERQTGTLAQVIGGQIGRGEVAVPVAVKLQRDTALSQEDRGSVAAKFDKERNVHRRLQACGETGGQERIVRQLEVWSRPGEGEADALEPCILCARARHGLAPRCPECNDPAAVLEELQLTDDHGLRCSRCHRQFWSTPKTRDAILDATLRHDPACRGCPLEHQPSSEECRGTAAFLNFFRNRVLLLERLDLDLDDYYRWQRGGPSHVMRAPTRQAYDEHRRQARDRRDRLYGTAIGKIADLRHAVELFSEVMAAVEHLHRHGVAHLDLKPANVCVRFRGPDLEVKVIDLGLSDDPNTLTYLRQAEGPLSLWTDYSAPEFRRPRSRPIEVAGRFREDVCELDWPPSEAPAGDLPCPGDVLFFEDRDPLHQRFQVVAVRPGRSGGLLVQARAAPEYRPWLGEVAPLPPFGPEAQIRGGLAVVLEKHCGFPADVFSLGMLLLAVLAENPDVADFREALPGAQIELEEQLRERPAVPARALVHLLLGRPSKHLHVFHAHAHRLAAYGIAQPLAEELLGLVLRATLRGDPRVYYLVDRGGDARVALRRFRSDLDAVRVAVGNALAAAQAGTVRAARLAVLDQLRGQLRDQHVDIAHLPRAKSDGRLVYPTLDLGSAGEDHRRLELANLPAASQLGPLLDRWERELDGQAADNAPGRSWDFLIRYCRRLDFGPAPAVTFLEHYRALTEEVAQAGPSASATRTDDRERLLLWVDECRQLAERLEEGLAFVRLLMDFLGTLNDRLLRPWDRALKVKRLFLFRREVVRLPLGRAERLAVRDQELGAALDGLEATVRKAVIAGQQRARDFEAALAQWQVWCAGRCWIDALAQVEADALRQRERVSEEAAAWYQGWTTAARYLRDFWAGTRAVLQAVDAKLAADPGAEEISIRLSRTQRNALDPQAARDAATWLQQHWPAPSERVEALFALWDLGISDS